MAPSQTLRYALAAALATLAGTAGCGGQDRAPAPRSDVHHAAPVVVSLKRWAGSDPAEDDILVRRDRTAELHLIHGGAGGHFRTIRMSATEWARLRRALAGNPLADPGPRAGRPVSGAYRYVVVAHGHAAAGDDGALPRRLRPVVAALTAVIDHHAF